MKWVVTLTTLLVIGQGGVSAQRAVTPADATVFIRLVGSVRAEVEEAGAPKQTADLTRVENPTPTPNHNPNTHNARDPQDHYRRTMAVGSRRLDVDTNWLKEFGVIGSKDSLTVEQFHRLENDSEEKFYKLREQGAAAARRLLGS